MTRHIALVAALGMFVASACAPAPAPAPAPVDTSADVAAINQLASQEMALFTSGATTGLDAVFAADFVGMPPNEPLIQGLPALVAWADTINEQFTLGGGYDTSDVVVSGDWAVHRFTGSLTMTPKAGGDAMSEAIKGVHVLQRQADGSWRITQDVWNSDAPPPPMAPGGN
jgi:ketosteroid isomerase-like protein